MTQTALPLERTPAATRAIRGPVLTFVGDPFQRGLGETMRYEPDAIVAIEQGRITQVGAATKVRRLLPPGTEVERYGNDSLIMAGFIDCHVHFPQIPIIGAGGAQLLDWLEKYTFIAEQRFETEASRLAVLRRADLLVFIDQKRADHREADPAAVA